MATGATIIKKCITEASPGESLELRAPRFFCLVCSSWPAIRAKTEVGGHLVPGCAGKRALTRLRAFAHQQDWGLAEKLGAHASRRGAARASLGARGLFARLLGAGHWRSPADQLYPVLSREKSQAVADILVEAFDFEDGHQATEVRKCVFEDSEN